MFDNYDNKEFSATQKPFARPSGRCTLARLRFAQVVKQPWHTLKSI